MHWCFPSDCQLDYEGGLMNKENSYRTTHIAKDKGKQYDSYYVNDPWQAFMWHREQICINELLAKHLGNCEIRLLDFACGSGRVTKFLENRVVRSVGVDVSDSMLEQARGKLTQSELFKADLTQENVLKGQKFNLITAFRFFTNAEDELRLSVMQKLPEYLEKDGFLLFNNHHIPDAMYFRTQRLLARIRKKSLDSRVRMMSMDETLRLITEAGLKPVATRHVGFFHLPRLNPPIAFTETVESVASHFKWTAKYCESVMVLCTR